MQPTTETIKSILEDPNFHAQLERIYSSHPSSTVQETTIAEVYEGMKNVQNLVLDSIENGAFEKLPFNSRNSILSHLTNVKKFVGSPSQLIPQYNGLSYVIQISGLYQLNADNTDFEEKVKEINSLRRRYKKLLNDLDETEEIKTFLEKLKTNAEENAETITSVSQMADELSSKYEEDEKKISAKTDSISEAEQEIENRKKEILAFASNIKDNEEKLEVIYNELKKDINEELIVKINKAGELIDKAEKALELRETEGIAAAYSSRLAKISESKNKRNWLYGALGFVVFTLLFGYLLTGGQFFGTGFKETNNIGIIIGRIVLTAIGVSGAVFCAKRFVVLRNLEEDYEYKVVLTKSILAFANKIKDINEDKVAEYLTQVLNELHQDPLRERKGKNEDKDLTSIENIGKLTDLFQKIKAEG